MYGLRTCGRVAVAMVYIKYYNYMNSLLYRKNIIYV